MELKNLNYCWCIIFLFRFVHSAVDYASLHRLPNDTVPYHYDMDLEVKLEPEFTYHGNVSIDFVQLRPTQTIILHSNNLKINKDNSFMVDKEHNKVHFFRIFGNYKSNNFLVLKFENPITEGTYTLRLQFSGDLNNSSKGLYKTDYGDGRWIASTQFEPAEARRMFPCFDEPQLKSTFDLRVIHPRNRSAISNTAVANKMYAINKIMTSFKRSPIMSTYLLALAITDYDHVESELENKKFRLYVDPRLINYTLFAQDTTLKAVALLENVLGVDYSMNKLDQIVIPSFSGGMENWGLIVYGNGIIYKPNITSEQKRINALNLIAHELAHQWFGNLVTCQWWSYIWLNEGFATYYGHLIADAIEPQRRIMEKHIASEFRNIMISDSKVGETESLNREVLAVGNIFSKFNSISYTKGSAIVYFMSSIFANFNQSITNYLKTNAFKAATPDDLFFAIDETNKLDYKGSAHDIMSTWTDQDGYPFMTLTIDYDKNVASISQKQFIISSKPQKSDNKWWIPITMSTENSPDFDNLTPVDWVRPEDEGMIIKIHNTSGWVVLNHKNSVYCRVNYDETNWKRLMVYLNGSDYQKIHVLNRAQLIDDAMNLARAGELSYEIALNMTTVMHKETDPIVWVGVHGSILFLSQILTGSPIHYKYLNYISQLSYSAHSKVPSMRKDLTMERDIVEEFHKKFRKIKSKSMKGKQRQLYKIFSLLSDNIYNKNDFSKVENLFATKIGKLDEMEAQISQTTMRKIENNIEYKQWWFKMYYKDVERWLRARGFY